MKQTAAKATYYAGDAYQTTLEPGVPTRHRYMVYANGRAVAQVTQNEDGTTTSTPVVKYIHDDLLGSTESVTSSDAAQKSTQSFSVFGVPQEPLAAGDVPYGFTGQEEDAELGLVNMQGRMYEPVLGQFVSPDPMIQEASGQGLNRFAYAFNSPLNYVDPSGFVAAANYGEFTMNGENVLANSQTIDYSAIPIGGGGVPTNGVGTNALDTAGTGAGLGTAFAATGLALSALDLTRSVAQDISLSGSNPTTTTTTVPTTCSNVGLNGSPGIGQVQTQLASAPTSDNPYPREFDPASERHLRTLHPIAEEHIRNFLNELEDEGYEVQVTDGYVSYGEQAKKYSVGRGPDGKPLPLDTVKLLSTGQNQFSFGHAHVSTNAQPGRSAHNFGAAVDINVMRDGKPLSHMLRDRRVWRNVVDIAQRNGLTWGGDIKGINDPEHFEFTGGSSIDTKISRYRSGLDVFTGDRQPLWRPPWGSPVGVGP